MLKVGALRSIQENMDGTAPSPASLENPPFPLSATDRRILATKDEAFQRITWDQLKDIIGSPRRVDMARSNNG